MTIIHGLKQAPNHWQAISIILWISFLIAGAATGVFFSLVDPETLGFCVNLPQVSRMTAYSIGFFLFWLLSFASGFINHLFLSTDS